MKSFRCPLLLSVVLLLGACVTTPDVIPVGNATRADSAILRVPAELAVLQVDGQTVDLPIALSDPYDVPLTPGEHTVFLRFDAIVGKGQVSYPVKSEPVALRVDMPAGALHTFRYEQPVYDASRSVARDFQVDIVDAGGSVVSTRVAAAIDEAKPLLSVAGDPPPSAETRYPVERMIYWWLQGSKADRAAFRAWLQAQEGG